MTFGSPSPFRPPFSPLHFVAQYFFLFGAFWPLRRVERSITQPDVCHSFMWVCCECECVLDAHCNASDRNLFADNNDNSFDINCSIGSERSVGCCVHAENGRLAFNGRRERSETEARRKRDSFYCLNGYCYNNRLRARFMNG